MTDMRLLPRFFVTLAAVAVVCAARAQSLPLTETSTNDIQARFSAALEIPLGKQWALTWSEEARLKNNWGSVDKILSGLGVEYEPLKCLKAGVEYVFVNDNDLEDGWGIKHRLNANVTGTLELGRFELSLRERVRLQFRSDSTNRYEKPDPFITLRSRLKVAYDIRKSHWKPYVFAELYTTLNAPGPVSDYTTDAFYRDNYINRVRLGLGARYKINNHNSLDFYYMVHFNRDYRARYKGGGEMKEWSLLKECNHVFGIDYKFKL